MTVAFHEHCFHLCRLGQLICSWCKLERHWLFFVDFPNLWRSRCLFWVSISGVYFLSFEVLESPLLKGNRDTFNINCSLFPRSGTLWYFKIDLIVETPERDYGTSKSSLKPKNKIFCEIDHCLLNWKCDSRFKAQTNYVFIKKT